MFLTARRAYRGKVYHVNGADWLRTGRALCGFDTTNALYTTGRAASLAGLDRLVTLHHRRLCERCYQAAEKRERSCASA